MNMDAKIKSLVKSEIWPALCEEVVSRIKNANGEPIPTTSRDEVFAEVCRREGRAEIVQLLRSIQDEVFKTE